MASSQVSAKNAERRTLKERREAANASVAATKDALRRTEEAFRLFVDRVEDRALFTLDVHGTIVSWNTGAEHIWGYVAGEALGRHYSIFRAPDDVAGDLELHSCGADVRNNGWRVRKDGTRFWADETMTPLFECHGRLRGFTVITRDTTQTRSLEASLAAALRARDTFMAIASHELRTPLTALQLLADSALRRKEELPPWVVQKLTSFQRSLHRLSHLLTELLDVSRISAGSMHLVREEVDLEELAIEVVDRFRDDAEKLNTPIVVTAKHAARGQWDRTRVDQIVTNLLSNALKFASGKPVEIEVDADDARARLVVHDHGPGIAPEDQKRIFERFERVASEHHYGGFGLGLWITREVAQAMHGRICVESHAGEGTTFVVELPRNDGET